MTSNFMEDFTDLELLAQQPIESGSIAPKDWGTEQYQNVSLEEIFDLLDSVVESYNSLVSTLPAPLQQSAQVEIQFLTTLFQERLSALLHQPCHPAPALLSLMSFEPKKLMLQANLVA